jgi:thiamine biosynthesis lipoprotein
MEKIRMRHRNAFRDVKTLSFVFMILLFTIHSAFSQQVFKKKTVLMGSVFEIVLVENDSTKAELYFQKTIEEIERIENLISEWRPHTPISLVNQNAGIKPVKVDRELFDLTQRAIHYSKITDGAFDISIAALDKVWVFDGTMETLPSDEEIKKSIQNVGYQHIQLDSINYTIFLAKKGMKIGFGSIGKGYAADKGRELLQSMGVLGGIVNASGDLSSWGTQPNGKPWRVGISNPFKPHKIHKVIKLKYGSATTSGSSEKYAEINGKRYSHIINPKTGWPSSGLTSVTVLGPNAEFANFLSTSIMVVGKKNGRRLIHQFATYKAIILANH